VSKNVSAAGIGLDAVKLEIGGQATAVLSQTRKQFTSAGRLLDREKTSPRNIDLDVVPFLEVERTARLFPHLQTCINISRLKDIHH
jgi:7,8-dihydro-6-hydroxymethylpterin-pyrophosphokinase